MGKKAREYQSGDFIFAKVKGYPAWPARVQRQNGKKYFVYFYGTGETANLPPNMIFDYSENKDKFLNKSVKRKDFNDGVKQIEHDFTNNVPLEEVIGAVATDAVPADTLNDTANDSAEDSAIGDTTADETMDENAANSTANDGPVEDSDDAGALVIDEGKQKGRKSAAKTPATPKAKDKPRGRPRKEEAKETEPEEGRKEEEIVSRSGRKIRPKKYMDEHTEENTTLPSPAVKKRRGASPVEKEKPESKDQPQEKKKRRTSYNTVQQSELRDLKEPFKSANAEKENILITYLPSGEYCGVKLFTGRPASFKNEAARLQWDKQAASNAITLKGQLEKGQITPQSISAQLVMDLNLTDEEKATLDRDRDLEMKKARLHFLRTEMKLIELDAKIKTCISLEKADTELCLKLIDEILELDLAALMLLKHPTCMETVKRMRVYVGNTPSWEMSESEALTFSKQAHHIRNKADALFITMRDLFDVPEGLSFWEYFHERVAQFKAITSNLHADKLLEMTHEPIELSQPASHTMKAAIDAANEDEPVEEDAAQKKKATPAKGKKANSTPSKTPLKRQSSRKQEDKESDKEKPKDNENEKANEVEKLKEEADTNKANDTEKDTTEPKDNEKQENNTNEEKTDEPEKVNDVDLDKEVEKVNENAGNNEENSVAVEKKDESEKANDVDEFPKAEANSIEKDEKAENSVSPVEEKEKDGEDKEESNSKDSKKGKDEKNSVSDKNSKAKDKKDDKVKEDVKNGKDSKDGKAKAAEKRKEEKSEEKDTKDADEPRAKRSREIKKTDPPPRSPLKRKSKF